jgi:hypothetical protein
MDNNNSDFDFSLIAQDVDSSDGQTRYIYGQAKPVEKEETVEESA